MPGILWIIIKLQMNRFTIAFIAIVATLAFAETSDPSGWPSSTFMHAHCEIYVTYAQPCSTVFTEVETTIKTWVPSAHSNGILSIQSEQAGQFVWMTRTTPVKHYIDDVLFKMTDSNGACDVHAKSRSQTLSVYDYDTNFCNMRNVLKTAGTYTFVKSANCAYSPTAADEEATCNKY